MRKAKYGFPLLWCVRLPCSRACAWFPSCYMLRFDLADRDKLVRRGDRRHFACHFNIDRYSHGRSRSKLLARLHRSVPRRLVRIPSFHPSPKADRAEVKSGDKSFFPRIGDGRTRHGRTYQRTILHNIVTCTHSAGARPRQPASIPAARR